MPDPHIGPTGEHGDGKISEDDERQLILAVIADSENHLVAIDFGVSLSWFAMTPDQALYVAESLTAAVKTLSESEALHMTPSERNSDAETPE